MEKDLRIRKATIKDLKIVYQLEKKFVNYQIKKYRLHSIADPNYVNNPLKREVAEALRSRKKTVFILEKNREPIGFTGLRLTKPPVWRKSKKSAEIAQLFILPKYHGKGYGKLLLNHALDFLKKEKKCDLATLGVHTKNPAQRLYSRAGFKQDYIQMYKKLK